MAQDAAKALIKKGKLACAAFIQEDCLGSAEPCAITIEILNSVLNPCIPIHDGFSIEWCRWLIAGGKPPEEFAQTVKKFDTSSTCGLVWTANFVAYRCRTCSVSPCMSLCSECFQLGDHEGHDFNMFRSQAGGACDCGDKSVMREAGFCQRHGGQNPMNKQEPPHELLCVAKALVPRLLLRLVQHFRMNIDMGRPVSAHYMADGFLSFLQNLTEMGAAMRGVMARALLDQNAYYSLSVLGDSENQHGLGKYLARKFNLPEDDLPEDVVNESDCEKLKESSFLEELVFWVIHFEFPQKMVFLLLNMMPDLNYKKAFIKVFVSHYDRLASMLATTTDCELLSNRVVHVSVQLFSNEMLALYMTKEHKLLETMVKCLIVMMHVISQKSTLQNPEKNEHLVVNCSHHIMKEHCYWPLVSDLNNVFTHAGVAHEFLSNTVLLQGWFRFISLFQGMNVNEREVKAHVEFESNTYYAAFTAELESCSTPMWALISHLKNEESIEKTNRVISVCLEFLDEWFTNIGFSLLGEEINPLQVTFHLPLHRCFASFLGLAVRQLGASLSSILPSDDTLKLLMMHPLQAQVAFHEILCNMWVRNGLQIKGQAMTYIQSHFCNSVVDADLFLLQVCAIKLDPDWYLQTVLQRFHVWEWFTFHPTRNNTFLENDKVLPLLEGALSFLCTLISTRTNLGESEEETIRQEMVSLLCMGDKTHSQLMELLPDKCGEPPMTRMFETVLNQVADYKAPNFEATGAMMQGMYVPKPSVWENEYDPIHVLLRAVHRRDYQSSLDRYTEYLRLNNKLSGSRPPWPPFRIPAPVLKEFQDLNKILQCKTMHAIIFTILHRAVYDPDLPEQILSFCIYLLDMAVRCPSSETSDNAAPQESKEVEDFNFESWFDGNDTLRNVTQEISPIVITEKVVMSMEEMEVDEDVEEVDVQLTEVEGYYDVHSPEMEMGLDVVEALDHEIMESPPPPDYPQLPPSNTPMALPAPSVSSSSDSKCTQLVPFAGNGMVVPSTSSASSNQTSLPITSNPPQLAITASADGQVYSLSLVPAAEGGSATLQHPKCLKLKQAPGRHPLLPSGKGPPLAIGAPEGDTCSELQRYHSFSYKRCYYVGESILSLLLRLHSKLSETADSYKPQEVVSGKSRIGDDLTFIQGVLDRIVASGEEKRAAFERTRRKLWRQERDVNMSPASDKMDKCEKRRRARDRQKKLIAEFASKQKAFLQKTMEADFKESEMSGLEDPAPESKKEYECVICSQMSSSEEDRPVGLVVLLQSTSGHSHEKPERKLPCDDDLGSFNQGIDMITSHKDRTKFLSTCFIPLNVPTAFNIGWDGGVHVQTCGHYLHIDCHKSYLQSLMSQNQMSSRLQNLNVEQGEFFCPLCRQLANSVLPLRPDFPQTPTQHEEQSLPILVEDVGNLLASSLSEGDSNILKKYMGGIMEDLTNATLPQCRGVFAPSHANLYVFVCSIARTNLELELVQRKFLYESSKKSCFVPLLHVLSLHSILLMKTQNDGKDLGYTVTMWKGLTEADLENWIYPPHLPNPFNPNLCHDQVPLLMRDAIALLLQLVLSMPLNIDKVLFQCVIQMVYNLLYVQCMVSLSLKLDAHLRSSLAAAADATSIDEQRCISPKLNQGRTFLGYIVHHVQPIFKIEEEPEDMLHEISDFYIEEYIQNYSLHFLKFAALLQSHLYKEDIMLKAGDNEFQVLSSYLGMSPSSELFPTSLVRWSTDQREIINVWCSDFKKCLFTTTASPRDSLHPIIRWHPPTLLRLPYNYDEIFKYYHEKSCDICSKTPKDPSVCLVCGVMVCLREKCCREQFQYEAVKHSVVCGAGTAIYLAVNSSTIIVIRGKRACLWGSVYLDSYGEEDRDLKRGKPLYLSEDRYRLLQQQWINHSFDHTNKRWVWHKDNL